MGCGASKDVDEVESRRRPKARDEYDSSSSSDEEVLPSKEPERVKSGGRRRVMSDKESEISNNEEEEQSPQLMCKSASSGDSGLSNRGSDKKEKGSARGSAKSNRSKADSGYVPYISGDEDDDNYLIGNKKKKKQRCNSGSDKTSKRQMKEEEYSDREYEKVEEKKKKKGSELSPIVSKSSLERGVLPGIGGKLTSLTVTKAKPSAIAFDITMNDSGVKMTDDILIPERLAKPKKKKKKSKKKNNLDYSSVPLEQQLDEAETRKKSHRMNLLMDMAAMRREDGGYRDSESLGSDDVALESAALAVEVQNKMDDAERKRTELLDDKRRKREAREEKARRVKQRRENAKIMSARERQIADEQSRLAIAQLNLSLDAEISESNLF